VLHATFNAISDTGGASIQSYHVQYKRSSSSIWLDVKGFAPFNTDLFALVTSGVESGQAYDFRN